MLFGCTYLVDCSFRSKGVTHFQVIKIKANLKGLLFEREEWVPLECFPIAVVLEESLAVGMAITYLMQARH